MSLQELTFRAMGARIRVLLGQPGDPGLPPVDAALEDARRFIEDFDRRLSRFRPDSELSALNGDARESVPVSPLLAAAVGAGIWAAERSGGLVDPTLVDQIEAAGYAASLEPGSAVEPAGAPTSLEPGTAPALLEAALSAAPARRPASPAADARWRDARVDREHDVVHRPAGLRFDTGGSGKGLAADALAHRLAGYAQVVVDCGGDVRVGGTESRPNPFPIEVEQPLTGAAALRFVLGDGAVATSGIGRRIWQRPDGGFAHHLLDPATGAPAWTGLVQVTAIGYSALEAETLAKAALLSGPARAREMLTPLGGLLIHEDGEAEPLGSLDFGAGDGVTGASRTGLETVAA